MGSNGSTVWRFVVALLLLVAPGLAQTGNGALRGRVTDPSGAVVQNATVTATNPEGKQTTATSNAQGVYELKNLVPGTYTVVVTAKGFTTDTEPNVTVAAGAPQAFDIALKIAVEKEQVQVQDQTNTVDTSSSGNASALILKGKDLEALSDDPDELQNELEALAGPSAGPNGGQMYIDGFTAGQLPPKASIREIRVNQNPFSAEYDKLGYGRIEIFTKPGLDQFHGRFFVVGNDSNFNATNPFAAQAATIPPYHSEQFSADFSGPIVSKRASFAFEADRRNINDESVVVAQVLDPDGNPTAFNQVVATPRERTNISPRLDFQLTPNNTLTARYQYWLDNQSNQGVGQFSLPELGYNTRNEEHTFQVSDTQILSPTIINETRLQYVRDFTQNTPLTFAPQITVQGAFTGGGNSSSYLSEHEDRFEIQNYTSIVKGKHLWKFGGRVRTTRDASSSVANFFGTYTFASLGDYKAFLNGTATPSQYSQTFGNPALDTNYVDAGLYFQDEYKMRPNLTLSYGLRFETQNEIGDHGDWAPRVGIAWGIDGGGKSAAKTVLRAGYGIFYDRIGLAQIQNTQRLNGTDQREYVIQSPVASANCPLQTNAPMTEDQVRNCGGTLTPQSTIYQFSPGLRAPYTMQAAVSLERQLWKNATGALTYINSRGLHQLVEINANAPYLPDFNPGLGNIYQYFTQGVFKQNQLIVNINWRAGNRFSLFGNYTLGYANSDVNGFATNSADITADYGRAAFDNRNRLMLGGSFALPYGTRFSPFIIASSGRPYNVTLGDDVNGDSIFNDRPYFCASTSSPSCLSTVRPGAVSNYSRVPTSAGLIPINFGDAPGQFTFNMRLGKTFGLGPKIEKGGATGAPGGGGGHMHGGGNPFGGGMRGGFGGDASDRKYNLTFNVMVRNLFNNVNLAAPIGSVASPFFGESIALAGGPFGSGAYNRRLDLQLMFAF